MRPSTLHVIPSLLLCWAGGALGLVLLLASLELAPLLGLPDLGLARLAGSLVSEDPDVAAGLGIAAIGLGAAIVVPALVPRAWSKLPGDGIALRGALLKGILLGLVLGVLAGLAIPALEALRAGAPDHAHGFFALGAGIAGPATLLGAHVLYGLAVALVAWMGQGLRPLDTLGWQGVGKQGAHS